MATQQDKVVVNTIDSNSSSIALSSKNLTGVGTVGCGAITSTGTSVFSTLQGTNLQLKYGGAAYNPLTMPMYSHGADLFPNAGTTTLITITLAAGLVGTTGDIIRVEAWGNATTAATTRTIELQVNGSSFDGFNLVSGSNSMWHATWKLIRRTATLCDVLGEYQHGSTSGTFGTIDRSTTSFGSAGSIVLRSVTTGSNEFRIRGLIVTFHPKNTPA